MTTAPKFNSRTGAFEVARAFPDAVKHKTIIVTGVSLNGLGMSTAEALASQAPLLLILTGRSAKKVQDVIDVLAPKYPATKFTFLNLDLSSIARVRDAAAALLANPDVKQVDLLICNAGVMTVPTRELSEDGNEIQFATNHIGHFLFTNLIMDKLIASAKTSPRGSTRVVVVSSSAHHFSPVRFSDPNFTKTQAELPEEDRANAPMLESLKMSTEGVYSPYIAYGQSKSANCLHALGLNRRLLQKFGIRSYAIHPGVIFTDLWRHTEQAVQDNMKAGADAGAYELKNLDQGASTTLEAALDPDLAEPDTEGNNYYLSDCQLLEPAAWCQRAEGAEKLWDLSESIVKQKFSW
ncbi:hypothetical protein AYO20_07069 [Fonsecaea nubica]|uniref:Uncharacterized protein n=1 Tax=Fonsecaea nubica TaxID=856822 RepID=A0A178CXS2_9EURO|nr:hypothetical protein AYO20_07069 [Fonsecaea nubica]OAL33731.1 hypothetical protein AYO20_07069 [Fonsecaea nubica]